MKTVVLILPTFNEKENIVSLIDALYQVFKTIKGYSFNVLVVDDYSPDGTGKIVSEMSKKYKNLRLISKEKEGLGAAIMFGVLYAQKHIKPDFYMQMDADWSHNPKLIEKFIQKIENGADFVVGSRYIEGGSIPKNWGWHRKLFSIIGNIWVRFGLGAFTPHDWSSGFRMMRKEVLSISKGLDKYSGYTFQIAFLHRVKKARFKVEEVPLVFVDRVHGRSKFPAWDYIKNVILYVINHSTFIKYLVIGVIGFIIQSVIAQILISIFKNKNLEGTAVGVGSFFAIVTNFFGNNLWTFSNKRIRKLSTLFKKFIHFLITSSGAIIIQKVVVDLGVRYTTISWFWWMVFAIGFLVIPYNYFIYSRFIWKSPEK